MSRDERLVRAEINCGCRVPLQVLSMRVMVGLGCGKTVSHVSQSGRWNDADAVSARREKGSCFSKRACFRCRGRHFAVCCLAVCRNTSRYYMERSSEIKYVASFLFLSFFSFLAVHSRSNPYLSCAAADISVLLRLMAEQSWERVRTWHVHTGAGRP